MLRYGHNMIIKRVLVGILVGIISFAAVFVPSNNNTYGNDVSQLGYNKSIDLADFSINIAADAGVIPEGAEVSITNIPKSDTAKVEKAVNRVTESESRVMSKTFDIKFTLEGEEIQPNGDVSVTFKHDYVKNKNLTAKVYHINEKAKTFRAETMDVTEDGKEAKITTNSFSYFTVEFVYGEKEFVIEGKECMKLKDLIKELGLEGDIEEYSVSNPELFDVYLAGLTGPMEIDGEFQNDGKGSIPWFVSLKPFDTNEWLKVTLDGIEYVIDVTDDQVIIGGRNPVNIDGVEQGQYENNFTANMPIGDFWINEDIINMSKESREYPECIVADAYKNDPRILGGVTSSYGTNTTAVNLSKITVNNYKASLGGDIVTYVFKDAAQDAFGNPLDVHVTYGDLQLFFEKDITTANLNDLLNNTALTLWQGNTCRIAGFKLNADKNGMTDTIYGDYNKRQRVGAVWNTSIQLKTAAGDVVEGSFYFPMIDVDVNRYTTSSTGWGAMQNGADYRCFSECLKLDMDCLDPDSKVYIPGSVISPAGPNGKKTWYQTGIEPRGDDLYFYPISGAPASGADWDETFYTGFMTLIDNTKGLQMQNQFGGTGNAVVTTYILSASVPVQHKLKSSTTTYDTNGNRIGGKNDGQNTGVVGGRIQTTRKGNKDGKLFDGSKVINESTMATANGQSITFTLTPEPGYRLKGTVKVSDVNTDYNVSTTEITPTAVYDAFGNIDHYTYTFDNITTDKSIHVDWEPTNLNIKKEVVNNEHATDDTFTFNLRIWNPNVDTNEYLVRAYKQSPNPLQTRYEWEEVTAPKRNEKYLMVDGNGYLMYKDRDENTGKWWGRTPVAVDTPSLVDPRVVFGDACLFKYVDDAQILTSDNERLLQRADRDDMDHWYQLYYGDYVAGKSYFFNYTADNHAIAWGESVDKRDEGSEEEPLATNLGEGNYGIVNNGEHKIKLYKLNEVEYREFPVQQEYITSTEYYFTQDLDEGATFLMNDGLATSRMYYYDDVYRRISYIQTSNFTNEDFIAMQNREDSYSNFWFYKDGDKIYTEKDNLDVTALFNSYAANYNRTYIEAGIATRPVYSAVDSDYYTEYYDFSDYSNDFQISASEDGYYLFEGADTPNINLADNWTVEIVPNVKSAYDPSLKLAALGINKLHGSQDTYQFTLTTEDLEKDIDLMGIVPMGWNYTLTEVGETGNPGTKKGFEFVSKTANANVTNFDGNENVVVTNKRNEQKVIVEKTWADDDNAAGLRPNSLGMELTTEDRDGNIKVYTTPEGVAKDGNKWAYTYEVPWAETATSVTEGATNDAYECTKEPTYNLLADKWEVENSIKKCAINVTKSTDIATDDTFNFKIKVWKEVNGERVYRDITGDTQTVLTPMTETGAYKFTMASGGNVRFDGIPFTYKYEIVELDEDDNPIAIGGLAAPKWKLADTSSVSGTINNDAMASETDRTINAGFENEMVRGSVNVKKETLENKAGTFNFKIKVTAPNGWQSNGETQNVPLFPTMGSSTLDIESITNDNFKIADNTWEYPFTLDNGDDVTFENIPYGFTYEVWEETPDGWVLMSVDGNTAKTKATGEITVEDVVNHVFKNRKNDGVLTLRKNVKGNLGDLTKEFEFTINLSGLDPNQELDIEGTGTLLGGVTDKVIADANGDASVSVKLKDDRYVTITGIPTGIGVDYDITEAESDHDASYVVTVDDVAGTSVDSRIADEAFDEGEIVNDVTFTNTRDLKTVTGALSWLLGIIALLVAAGSYVILTAKRRRNN